MSPVIYTSIWQVPHTAKDNELDEIIHYLDDDPKTKVIMSLEVRYKKAVYTEE